LIVSAGLSVVGIDTREEALDPALKRASWHQNPPAALGTFETDVGPNPHNLPLVVATRMGFLEHDHVS
jgi:hypothetical protein